MDSRSLKGISIAVAVAVLVTGCETLDPYASEDKTSAATVSAEEHADGRSLFALGPMDSFAGTPLGFNSWVYTTYESAVPVMPTGASRSEVLRAVKNADLETLHKSRTELLVRDSMPNRQRTGYAPFLYRFEKGQLVFGPETIYVAMYRFGADGFDAREMGLLDKMLQAEVPDSRLANSLAWIYATYDVEEVRDARLAVKYAIRACQLTNYEHLPALDTLAAAYARAGEFDKAVEMQQRVVQMDDSSDPQYAKRLEQYRRGEAYTAPVEKAPSYDGRRDRSRPEPLSTNLLLNANLGNTRAQFLVARYYLNNAIDHARGLKNPGVHWLRLSAKGGDTLAQGQLGIEYIRGDRGVERDPEMGIHWMELGARGGGFAPAYNLSRYYSGKPDVEFPTDESKASYWMQMAADLGMKSAMFEMAYQLEKGIGVDRDPDKSQQYLASLALVNYGIVEYMQDVEVEIMALRIEPLRDFIRADGQPVDVSLQRIMAFIDVLQRAVDNNELAARFEFDGVTLMVHPVSARTTAASMARAVARLGFYDAQLRVADYYETGFGLDVSQEMADLIRKRASQNPHKGESRQKRKLNFLP